MDFSATFHPEEAPLVAGDNRIQFYIGLHELLGRKIDLVDEYCILSRKENMKIEDLIIAIQQAAPQLNSPVGKSKHEHVDRFQDQLLKALNGQQKYDWYAETIMSGGRHHDRADLYGSEKVHSQIRLDGCNIQRIHSYSQKYNICEKTCDNDWIIEIDATRADQVAAKFLSRLALAGLSSKIVHYVAVLYSYTQSNEASCIKYCNFAKEIMNKINPQSSIDLIIINQEERIIKFYNLKKAQYLITYKSIKGTNSLPIASMAGVVQAIVKNYIAQHKNVTFPKLQDIFGKYVAAESGPSRYKYLGCQLIDGTPVYTYSQWRNNYGSQENWSRFVNLCQRHEISIDDFFTFVKYNY